MGSVMSSAVFGAGGRPLLVDEAAADQLGPGLVAFTIVVLLGVATFFLIRSMLHHIRKVPPSFDQAEPEPDDRSGEGPQQRQGESGAGAGQP
jgi:hypothetical protein